MGQHYCVCIQYILVLYTVKWAGRIFAKQGEGKDVKAATIIQAIQAEDIKLVGLSALMTTTVKNMQKIITEIKASCPATTIMVGGAVLNPEYANTIGADYYGKDAREGAGIAKRVFE